MVPIDVVKTRMQVRSPLALVLVALSS